MPPTGRPHLPAARLVAGAALGLLAATFPLTRAPVAAQAPAPASGDVVPPLVWGACAGDQPVGYTIECSTALVPLDHDRPGGALVSIALLRAPATGGPRDRIGSMFVNPGGPGGSGTDFVRRAAGGFSPALRRAYDIVGFDPRGVGGTLPGATCPSRHLPDPPDTADPSDWLPYVGAFTAAWLPVSTSCVVANAAASSHIGTVDVARDLDLLRRAVGDARLTFVGYSYGTRIGSVYAQLFPGTVGRLLLDGNVGPFADMPEYFGKGDAIDDAFAAFRAWRPTAGTQFDLILQVLANGPVVTPDGTIDTKTFRYTVSGPLGYEAQWSDLAQLIDQIYRAVVLRTARLPAIRTSPPPPVLQAEPPPRPTGQVLEMVTCQDNAERPTHEEYAQAAAANVVKGPIFAFTIVAYMPLCDRSPVPTVPIPRLPSLATGPLLISESHHDPRTPWVWGVEMRSTAPAGSGMLIYEGANHASFGGLSPCIDAVGDAYLVDGTVPASDVSCPFIPPARRR